MSAFMTRPGTLGAVLTIGATVALFSPAVALGGIFSTLATSAAEKTLARSTERVAVGRVTADAMRVSTEAAMRRQLEGLDRKTLESIVGRYGSLLDRQRLARAQGCQSCFLSDEAFDRALARANPELSAAQRRQVVGFYRDQATVNMDTLNLPRTVAHERLHGLASPEFQRRGGTALNEGVTEYFAARIYPGMGLPEYRPAYPGAFRLCELLGARFGDERLARAYFGGRVDALAKAVDGELGRGAFADIARAAEAHKFDEAIQIVQRR